MGISDPHLPYWGLSPEGGTRIRYTGMSEGDIPDEDLGSEIERAIRKLRQLAESSDSQKPGFCESNDV